MPMDNGAIIDTLKIEVVGDSSKGVRSLESVVSALEDIETLSKDVNRPMNRVTKAIDKLAASVDNISSSKLNKLTSLAQALRYMSSVGKISITAKTADVVRSLGEAVDSLKEVDMKKLNDMADGLVKLKSVGNLSSVTRTLGKVKDMPAPQGTGSIDGYDGLNSEDLKEDQLSPMEKAATRLGYKLDELKNKEVKLFAGFSNFMRLVKKRIMYRMLNALISKVVEAFSTGIKNVYQYSKAINGDFAKAMDTIATASLYLKNSIGASVTSLIQNLAPALDKIVDKIVDFLNVANQVIARLSGERTWIKAIKYPQEYADALGDASKKAKELKKSLLGIDELNQLQDNSNRGSGSNNDAEDYMYMFETVALNYKYVDGILDKLKSIGKYVKLIVGTIISVKVMRGVATIMANSSTIFSTIKKFFTEMPVAVQKLTGAAGIVGGFMLCMDAGKSFADYLVSGNGLAGALGKLVGGTAMGAIGGFMVGGPVGAVIGGLSVLAGAILGVKEEQIRMAEELIETECYTVQGTAIQEVSDALDKYFQTFDFDKLGDWIKKVDDATKAYERSSEAYDILWQDLSGKKTWDTTEIENLATAFKNLADAAKAMNDAKIDSILSRISKSVEKNFTDSLTGKLDGLLSRIEAAKGVLSNNISNINARYQQVLNDVAANGGVASADQLAELTELRTNLAKYTLGSGTEKAQWQNAMNASKINAGASKDEILANVTALIANRDNYLNSIGEKYKTDQTTLRELVNMGLLDSTGRQIFREEDFKMLASNYNAQTDEVKKQYNSAIDRIIATYSQNFTKYNKVENVPLWGGLGYQWGANDYVDMSQKWTDVIVPADVLARSRVMKDYEELIKKLQGMKMYANGGFPDAGEMFIARESGAELVGSIGGKTAVMNNEQIVDSVSIGVAEANAEQNALLREQNNILRELLRKPTGGGADADDFIYSLNMKNRRDGKTVVPLGV